MILKYLPPIATQNPLPKIWHMLAKLVIPFPPRKHQQLE